MVIDEVGVDKINVSWIPPSTLDGVPILYYSVSITSRGHTEIVNTTDAHTILEKTCYSTLYNISAWNEVGEGNTITRGECTPYTYTAQINTHSRLSRALKHTLRVVSYSSMLL